MTLKHSLLLLVLALVPLSTAAQSISPAQVAQFKSLPKAQQESLARQYGIDLDAVTGSGQRQQAPQQAEVVEPLEQPADSSRAKKEAEASDEARAKNGGLEPFGYDLFAGNATTFAPVTEIPVPAEYTLGPGDVLRVQLWGKENQQLELPISRDGTISFPQSGPKSVAGLRFSEARQQIQKMVSEQYIGVQASVSLGELRSIRVFVLGEARTPGAYTVSSLSTISNALFVSGGIKQSGSLRKVQHKRNGKVVGELDLYDLLLKGDTSGDSRLQPGDAIFIPPVGPRVAVDGEVYRPALYELKGSADLRSVVNLAGGLTPQAYPQRVNIERNNQDYLRILAEADLTTRQGKQARVQPGDRIEVASVADITGQYVELKGAAIRPGRYAWVPGMRLSSVIGSLQSDLDPAADQSVALIVRTDEDTDKISTVIVQLREAVAARGTSADPQLAERDQILIFSDMAKSELAARQEDDKAGPNQASNLYKLEEADQERLQDLKRWQRENLLQPVIERLKAQASAMDQADLVQIAGQVRYPGDYPLPQSGRVEDAVFLAGGLKDAASLLTAELARFEKDAQGDGQSRILEIDLSRGLAAITNLRLQSRDRLLFKPTPDFAKRRTVMLEGEVRFPGEYTFRDGETLDVVIARAGGLTVNAFPKGAIFTREKLRQLEAQRLQEAEERLQGDLLGVQLKGDTLGSQTGDKVGQLEGLLKDVQSAKPVGRMVINLPAVLADKGYQPIRLQDGDRLTIPIIPQAVSVFGEVQFPTSHLHQASLNVDDYLERSGGPTRQADEDRVYIVKADGSVMMPKRSRWFGGRSQDLEPGDTVIVPIDVDRLNQLELWSNVSQIVYQMALGAAAVGNL